MAATSAATVSNASNVTNPSQTIVSIVFGYSPNKSAAGLIGALFVLESIFLFYRVLSSRTRGTPIWGLCLPISVLAMGTGILMRIPLAIYPGSIALFTVEQALTILPQTGFLAFNYILYTRLFLHSCVERRFSWIKIENVVRKFVTSDIITFSIVGTGAGLLTSTTSAIYITGGVLSQVGLVLQFVSFSVFMLSLGWTHWRLVRDGVDPYTHRWGIVFRLEYFSSSFYLLRCMYRIIEFAQNRGGYLLIHEAWFYVFDVLPLLIGSSVYLLLWPETYLDQDSVSPPAYTDSEAGFGRLSPPSKDSKSDDVSE
ncbi:RTA1 like protein-domain-containing protein [Hygrophoropsis aurantiaca]|uniref:RTA1 like protein-domain-containing protein n=1 Tax=Hygrophoropsis aurantiaca TaxID=72124 RepID=A0ACB8AGF4_9AGAM|nr:RTA1 like protein-domain-containing protein [Hygrophoropsis aurantiaca]